MTGLLLDTELDPEQREYAETVRSSGEALLAIINDILDLSKIEAGKLELEVIDFQLRDIIEGVLDLTAGKAHAKGLEINAMIEPEVPEVVGGDPGRLRQILMNLCSNAVKFTEHGEVVIRVSCEERGPTSGLLRFAVRDTGIGIPPEVRDRIFQSFSQADGTTTRRFGGTGLGLAISKKLVDVMGGTMDFDSEAGKGSEFQFAITLQVRSTLPSLPDAGAMRGVKVLCVDDNRTNLTIISRQLLAWNMDVTCVESSTMALENLVSAFKAGTPFQVAVLDYQMPDMDGIDLARCIRNTSGIEEMPLLLLTSLHDRQCVKEAVELGFAATLSKPVKRAHLWQQLAGARGNKAVSMPVRPEILSGDRTSRNARILIVEDNKVNQRVVGRMLERMGYRAEVAADGLEAVETLERNRYDLVFMDCQMPRMDGWEATREIRMREQGSDRRTTIIALTARAMEGERERCLESGMDDFLSKPVQMPQLLAMVERHLALEDTVPSKPV